MITLTTPKPLPANWTRWEVEDWEAHERQGWGMALVTLRTPGPTDYTISRQVFIRNGGVTDQVKYVATVHGPIGEQLVVIPSLGLPTGFDDAHAAYESGVGGRIAKCQALALFLLTSGIADSSMAGS